MLITKIKNPIQFYNPDFLLVMLGFCKPRLNFLS